MVTTELETASCSFSLNASLILVSGFRGRFLQLDLICADGKRDSGRIKFSCKWETTNTSLLFPSLKFYTL